MSKRRIISVSALLREIDKIATLPRDNFIERDAHALDRLADMVQNYPELLWQSEVISTLRRIAQSMRDYA